MCTELQTAVLPLWGVSRGGSGNVIGLSAPTPQIQLSLLRSPVTDVPLSTRTLLDATD